ncbi:MAG: hypothetical protein GJ680_18565 [Alteromonadaceae bacterium]|nr:hypothetical protein [Alteromonadaceae bacterium]
MSSSKASTIEIEKSGKDPLVEHIKSTHGVIFEFFGENCVQYRKSQSDEIITISRDKFDAWKKSANIDLNF